MPVTSTKKRTHDERAARPSKKQKRVAQKQAEAEDEGEDFQAVNLLDSDEEDIHNAVVDDGESDDGASSSDGGATRQRKKKPVKTKKTTTKPAAAPKAKPETDDGSEADDNDSEAEEDGDSENDEGDSDGSEEQSTNTKSKRNDPTAFSTSISKILSTKLPTSRRADPVLARSASANKNARAAADAALESKAKRVMRQQRKEALEKGRVKDVLIASQNDKTGETEGTTAEILETERRLRKVAQRGVVKLFNAVRAAQVKAAEAERAAKKDGIIGLTNKESKVNEMSKKGFLDLIASGGGALKKGAIEES